MYTSNQLSEFKEMVDVIDQNPITTSNKIAEYFGKIHKNILRKIDSLIEDMPSDFARLNFELVYESITYVNSFGCKSTKDTKRKSHYNITKDGFMFVAMSLTGKTAALLKVKFIQAFNWAVEYNSEMQFELQNFSRENSGSIERGSYSGTMLQKRKMEKKRLAIKEELLKAKYQLTLL